MYCMADNRCGGTLIRFGLPDSQAAESVPFEPHRDKARGAFPAQIGIDAPLYDPELSATA